MLTVKNGQLKVVKYVVSENGTISSAMVGELLGYK